MISVISHSEQQQALKALRTAQDAIKAVYTLTRGRVGHEANDDPGMKVLFETRDGLYDLENRVLAIECVREK